MVLVVILTVRRAAVDKFRAFEEQAAAVMARYGGAIERTVVITPEADGEFIKEVHIVTFPSEEAFLAYQQDETLKKVAHLRQASVVQSEILVGEDGPNYAAT
jgi:uncharacterized protein (DUF1330 family)